MTVPGYQSLLEGSPAFNPDGPAFATWLNALLTSIGNRQEDVLGDNYTALVDDLGKVFSLATWTLTLDAAAALEPGWWAYVTGPGTVTADSGETVGGVASFTLVSGSSVLLVSDGSSAVYAFGLMKKLSEMLDISFDGPADGDVLRYDAASSKWVDYTSSGWTAVAVSGGQATIDLADGDKFLITVDANCELQLPANAVDGAAFAIRVQISGGTFSFTFAAGWLGDPPLVLTDNGDETVLAGMVLDASPGSAVVNLVKTIAA